MVNSILQYIEPQLKAYMQFLNRVDSPVFRISNGEMIKGNGQEKEVVTISDLNGNSLYIRQTQPETINERKALSSCDKEYNISARCKLVFYTFGGNDFTINPDKVKSKIVNTLARLDFSHYVGSSTEIKIDVNGTSLDIEKIYTEETGKEFTGNVWPTLVSVDFTLSYVDTNCNTCDIDDSETVVTWTPDLTPENCETKAICEVISKCDVITLLQEQTASLQEQIDNLPQSGLTCTDLPNCQTIIDILQSINDIVSGLPSSYFSCGDLAVCQTIIDIVSDISDLQTQVGTNTTDISTLQGQVSSLISDLGTLTTTVNNHISDTSNPHNVTLEQARSENSSISGDINANNNTIINLKDAVNPQEPITKIQFDTYVSAVGGNRGAIDCSTNPNYPASNQGDRWEVTVAGKIGGPSGINVDVYDEIVCVAASASGDQATVGVNFYIVQGNIERATETTNGYTSYATDAEVQAGTNNTKTITPLKLYNWFVALVQSIFVKKGTLTTNYIPKATASDTIGDSQIFDDGTNVGIGKTNPSAKVDILQNTVSTGSKAISINFNTIGEAFYMDDNGTIQFKTQAGVNITNSGAINLIAAGSNPYIAFKVNNGANTSGNLFGDNLNMFLQPSKYFGISSTYFNASASLQVRGEDSTSSNYALKVDNLGLNPLFYVRNDGLINIGGLTPSQIVETDASKNLVSAAKGTAYNKDFGTGTTNVPEIGTTLTADKVLITDANSKLKPSTISTTQLSYLDATSSIQNQLDAKLSSTVGAFVNAPIKQNITIAHTGTTAETKLFSVKITAGTMSANDILEYFAWIIPGSGLGNRTVRVYLNTSDAIGGTKVATYTFTTTSSIFKRQITFKNSLSSQEIIPAGTSNIGNGEASTYAVSNISSASVNFANDVWFVLSIQLATGSDNVSIYSIGSRVLR